MTIYEIEKATTAMRMKLEGKSDLEILIFLNKEEKEEDE